LLVGANLRSLPKDGARQQANHFTGDMKMSDYNKPRLISMNDACRLTSMSRTMINRYRAEGRFPVHVELGERRVAFVREEVEAWIEEKITARKVK
jgi:prophage regulatory protein